MVEHGVSDILSALSSGVAIVDGAARVRETNAELQRLLGASSEEVILEAGAPYARIAELLAFSAEATLELEEAIGAAARGEREHIHVEIEVTSVEPPRSYVVDGARIAGSGEPSVLLELRDVSQSWAQRRSLEEELHLLEALMDAIPNPIFYKDSEGVYLGCNRAFQAYIDLPRERVIGSTVFDVMPRDRAEKEHAVDLALLQQGGVDIYERRLPFPDRELHDLLIHKAAVMLGDGPPVGLVCVIFDITDRKRTEAALIARGQELREQNLRLSTPILELGDDIVALPLIGAVDGERAARIMERLLDAVATGRYRIVVLDVTGVEVVDAETAAHFTRVVRAVELLGARCFITGISPAVARALVELGIDLGSMRALRNLKQGIDEGQRLLRASSVSGSRGTV